jgi:hypothetical protein
MTHEHASTGDETGPARWQKQIASAEISGAGLSAEVRVKITYTCRALLHTDQMGFHNENYSVFSHIVPVLEKDFTNQLLTTIGYNWAEVDECSTNKNNYNPD